MPISKPTILAGHNDSGKSALIRALCFLLGKHPLAEEDRTYCDVADVGGHAEGVVDRCEVTEVEGLFQLDEWEQRTWGLPAQVGLRRRSAGGSTAVLEMLRTVAEDPRLRDLDRQTIAQLKELAAEFGLQTTGRVKDDHISVLAAFAETQPTTEDWSGVPKDIVRRLPQLVVFAAGAGEAPDAAVRTVMAARFTEHVEAADLREKIAAIETDLEDRLRTDAKGLCDHIQLRCPGLGEVSIEPTVSFRQSMPSAQLRVARASGQPVGLERSGGGSNRRVQLAVWEWQSNLLRQDEQEVTVNPGGGEAADADRPLAQTIVVYDEPDTYLDYGQQREVMRLILDQCALAHVDVVVATHSMNLIDGVDIADVVHLRLDGGRTAIEVLGDQRHESIDQHLGSIAAAVGLRNSVLLHERCFLAVEGESELQALPLLFRLAEGLPLQSAGIALWACGNNDGAFRLAKYLHEHGRTVFLAIDADSRSSRMFADTRLEEVFGKSVGEFVQFIGGPGADEFEATFTDAVWARVANRIWPRVDRQWVDEDFTALRPSGKFSKRVLDLLEEFSEAAPGGKPAMMAALASQLTDPQDIPAGLLVLFRKLRDLLT